MQIDNIMVQAAWAAAVNERAHNPRECWSAIHLSDLRARLTARIRR